MKLTHASAIILAVAAAQTLAVTPIPVAGCTKQVVVDPKYDSCIDFARDFDLTFEDLLKMNDKLRKDCLNLDTGEKMCVSLNPGGVNPPLILKKKKDSKDSKDSKKTDKSTVSAASVGEKAPDSKKTDKSTVGAASVGEKAPDSKLAPVKKAAVVVVAAPVPAAPAPAPAPAPAHAPLPAAVVVPVPATSEKTDEKKDENKNALSSTASFGARASWVAVAGVLLSLAMR